MKSNILRSIAAVAMLTLCSISPLVYAQGVGINATGSTPDPSAGIDIDFTDRGALIPRLTTLQRDNISNPAIGLQIYNLTTHCINYYNGSNWLDLCGVCPVPAGTDAGPDQANVQSGSTVLAANTPPSGATGAWTIESGSGGNVVSPNSPTSTFTGTGGTTYVLRWTVTNSCNSSYDEVSIEFAISPANVSGLTIWLTADAGVVESGGSVSQWTDQSGNGNHAFQNTAAEQPALIANQLNGLPVLRLDGDDLLLISGSQTVGTIFAVIKYTGGSTFTDYNGVLTSQQDPGGAGGGIIFIGNPGSTQIYSGGYFGGDFKVDGINTMNLNPLSSFHYVSGLAPSPGVFDDLQIGRDRPYPSRAWTGDIAEVIVYNGLLSPSDRSLIENYLAGKWGL